MQTTALDGGFANVPVEAARAFRAIMTAMARPGTIHDVTGAVPPAPLSPAAGAVILTLCDAETPVFLAPSHDTPDVRDWITFHTGAPFTAPDKAVFALGAWDELDGQPFAIGTPEYPDRSTTLIVASTALANEGAALSGPGIKDQVELSLPEAQSFTANARLFPLGLDFILTCDSRLAAVPRTTKISTLGGLV